MARLWRFGKQTLSFLVLLMRRGLRFSRRTMFRHLVVPLWVVGAGLSLYAQGGELKGIETSDLDRKVQPCDDFYEFSNGTWRAQNAIPASMDRWSRRWQAGETNKDQLKVILDEVSAVPNHSTGSPAQLTGDFYAACTNVKTIDAAGY